MDAMNNEQYPWKHGEFKFKLNGTDDENKLIIDGIDFSKIGVVPDSFCIKFDGPLPVVHLEIPLASCDVEIDGGIKINGARTHEKVAYEIYKKLQEHFFSQTIPHGQGS